jgi:hypothetical protein
VITPNSDGCNDFFALEGITDSPPSGLCQDFVLPNLPIDNCDGKFLGIRIYNRWGDKVFYSSDRKFRWYAPEDAAGVYFYYISYSNKEFKGSLSVRY